MRTRLRSVVLTGALASALLGSPGLAQDSDNDGVLDHEDNCVLVPNGPGDPHPQRDTNGDGFGNLCDSDYDGSGLVANPDFVALSSAYGCSDPEPCYDPDIDADGDLTIGAPEFVLLSVGFGKPPGPSGLDCAFLPPDPEDPPCPRPVVITDPDDGDATLASTVDISGTIDPPGTPVTVNQIPAVVIDGTFTASGLPITGPTTDFVAEATVPLGTFTDTIHVIQVQNPVPPPPALPDPPPDLNPTVATSVLEATEFLYTGAGAVQTGVGATTIDIRRAAVVRGQVFRRSGQGLPSVQVTIKGHTEFGQTLTRVDGMYDLVLNGGGKFTLRYEREGYLPVERQVEALWQEYRFVDDVVMIPVDSAETVISENAGGFQVAEANPVSDEDGGRQATILFPPFTTSPDVDSPFTVRATEYTVGNDGPETMPAELPPTSAYTYAVELSVDEATGAQVSFNQPVFSYLENFLDFRVGQPIPVGTYSSATGAWAPEDSGVVLAIVDIDQQTGHALLDVTGDGNSDQADAPILAQIGVTDAERLILGGLYAIDDELWRVPVTHFSPWDLNHPVETVVAPEDAVQPASPLPGENEDRSCDNNNTCKGSLIRVQNQSLGESVPIVGTPFSLHYSSERVPGRKLAATQLKIPLSGASLPTSVEEIEWEVQVAGRRFSDRVTAAPNLTTTFNGWNGLDAYGRQVMGRQQATVRVGYVYPAEDAQYQEVGRFFATNFGGGNGTFARTAIILSRTYRVPMGPWDARSQGMGGWTLNAHHAYDPVGQVVHLGDGTRQDASFLPRQVRHRAGRGVIGDQDPDVGDSGPATAAAVAFDALRDLVVGEDGSIYLLQAKNFDNDSRIRVIDPLQIINTLYGGGVTECDSADISLQARPAAEACFSGATSLDRGPDGTLYLSYPFAPEGFIHRIDPGGDLDRLAGEFVMTPTGEEGPRLEVALDEPQDVAAAPDGSVYVAERVGLDVVGVVTTDDLYTMMAGGGTTSPEDVAALGSQFQVVDIDVGPDGSIYIAGPAGGAADSDLVLRVFPDGRIEGFAGKVGTAPQELGDGGPATEANLVDIQRIAVAPDGGVYIATGTNDVPDPDDGPRVRFVGPEGIISTIVGNGVAGRSDGEIAGPETSIAQVTGMDVAPDGALLLATKRIFDNLPTTGINEVLVLEITAALPNVGLGDVGIFSEDRSKIYIFDNTGKHKETRHGLTDQTLLTFGYSAPEPTGATYLTSITDFDGNVTMIQRNGSLPSAIVSPDPGFLQTDLATNGNGYLSSITNPAGEAVDLTYHTGSSSGLLATFETPRNHASTFTYDSLGLLTKDKNAALGRLDLTASQVGTQSTVTTETAKPTPAEPKRTTTYQQETISGLGRDRVITGPNGLQTLVFLPEERGEDVLFPDGTQVVRTVKGVKRRGGHPGARDRHPHGHDAQSGAGDRRGPGDPELPVHYPDREGVAERRCSVRACLHEDRDGRPGGRHRGVRHHDS